MEQHSQILVYCCVTAALLLHCLISCRAKDVLPLSAGKGTWKLLLNNTGVVGVHMVLTHWNTVILFDRSGSGQSGLQLRHLFNGTRCEGTRDDLADSTCYAHSVECSISNNNVRHLNLISDTFSSSGSILFNQVALEVLRDEFTTLSLVKVVLLVIGGWGRNTCLKTVGLLLAKFSPRMTGSLLLEGEGPLRMSLYQRYRQMKRLLIFLSCIKFIMEMKVETIFILLFTFPLMAICSFFANRDSILFNYKRNNVVKKFPRIHGLG